MRKIFITGGAGFIGSYLVKEFLKLDCKVTALDNLSTGQLKNLDEVSNNKNFKLIIGDVLDSELIAKLVANADMVLHLAAVVGVKRVMRNPVDTIRINILGTENVLHSCSAHSKKVLIASTSEVYGKAMNYKNHDNGLNEDVDTVMGSTSVRRWSYATSKALDEFLALAYHTEKSLPVVIARYFNTVGPGQVGSYGMVLPIFIQKAISGEDIPVYGDGEQMRSFGYVRDAVKCTIALMDNENSLGEVFNIGNETEISINDLADLVIKKCNSSSKIIYKSYEEAYGTGFEDMKRRKPNSDKLFKIIGMKPDFPIEKVIEKMIIYFKSN